MSAAAAEGIDAIAAYDGAWNTDITHLDTPFSKAGHEVHALRNDCWRSGEFYACHQYLDGASQAIVVFAYDAKARSYRSWPITAGADTVASGQLIIDGDTWTFPWQTTEKGRTTRFRVVNVFGKDLQSIVFRQEFSADGVHWQAMADGVEKKLPPSRAPR